MRSFMKAHRRGSSSNIGDGSLFDLNTGTSTTDEKIDEKHNSAISASSSAQSSPIRQSPSSPIVARGKKLQRLFQRSKTSSQNLMNLSNGIGSSPSGNSPPPSIIGTRTHEWGKGSNDSHTGLTKPSSNRISVQSSQSSANSLYSLEGHNGLSSTSTQNRDANGHILTTEDSEGLHLPLNAVSELPNEASLSPFMRQIPDTGDMDKKMRHRRAQIISADSFKLEDPAEIVPVDQFYKEKEVSSPELFNDGFVDPDETVAETIQNEKQRRKEQKQESQDDADDQDIDRSSTSSGASEFSFEEDSKRGRNVSIKYYKSPEEGIAQQSHLVKEQGFYVNDLIDDNFDEDMNYYDEFDDDYNDDEEIFNKKYFSDDEEEIVPKKKQPSIRKVLESDKVTPTNSIKNDITPTNSVLSSNKGEITPKNSFTAHKNTALNHSNSQIRSNSTSRPADDLLKPRRSLKYHQLSTNYDQEIPQNRYSWFSDEEDGHHNNDFVNHSYDSLLDEINDIPEDFEFHGKTEIPSRSKSMNSSLRRNKGVYEDTPQNTKFESHNKTVTLFSRPSRQSSVKSNDSAEFTQQQQFGYLTPNGSFTMPTPGFVNGQNVELSPITEGSVDGSP